MKCLIIHTAFIGDIILSTPLIRALKEKYGNINIDYLTTPAGYEILKNNPLLDNIIVYDKKGKDKGIQGFFRILKKIKQENYDLAVIPHRYLRSNLLAFLGGVKERIGYKTSEASFLLTKKMEYLKNKHEVERILYLVEIENIQQKPKIELYTSDVIQKKIDNLWLSENLASNIIITVAPGSRWFTKMWPKEYYEELIQKILEYFNNNVKIILTGSPKECNFTIQHKNVINLIGKTTIEELIEIIRRSNILIANDSAPIHIASAFNTFIVAIFGATTPSLGFYPYSDNSIIVENKELTCRPCGLHGGDKCPLGHFNCMKSILPHQVFNIIKQYIEENENINNKI